MAERGQGRKISITLTVHEKDILDALDLLGEVPSSAASTGSRVHAVLYGYLRRRYLDDPEVRALVEARRQHRERERVDAEFERLTADLVVDRG